MDEWLGSGDGASNDSCPGAHKLRAEWVYTAFGECVDTPLKYVAFFVGLSSILCWLVAQAPQMVTNCRLGIADKALSFWFLLQWFLGDATNLIGALLTHQLPSQIITAIYFCLIDTLMMTQFFYYVIKNQGIRGIPQIFLCPKTAVAFFIPGLIFTAAMLPAWQRVMDTSGTHYLQTATRSSRVLLSDSSDDKPPDWHDADYMAGYVIGCVSAMFYLGSRLPQIIQNFMRCSVKGVSLPMFILAVMGNVTYSLGIFLYSVNGNFLLGKLPWLVGSLGTLCFDFTIFVQFIVYRGFYNRGRHSITVEHGTKDERRPLLTNEESLPCFSSRGTIQGGGEEEGEGGGGGGGGKENQTKSKDT